MEEEPRRSLIRAPNARERTQFEYVPTVIRVLSVTDHQIDGLTEGGGGTSLALAGMTFGAAFTAAVTLATVPLEVLPFACFWATLIVTTVLTIFFGITAFQGHRRVQKRLTDIKAGRTTYPAP